MSADNTRYTYSRGVELPPDCERKFNLTLAMENLSRKYPNFIQDSTVGVCTVYCYIQSPDLAEGWHYDFDSTKEYKELITQDYDGNLWRRSAMFGYQSNHKDIPIKTTGLRFYIKHGRYNVDKNKFLEKRPEEQISELINNGFKELEVYWQHTDDSGGYVLLDTSIGETRDAFVSDSSSRSKKIDFSLDDTRDSDEIGDVGPNDNSENNQGEYEYIFVGNACDNQDKTKPEESLNYEQDVNQQKDKKIANEQSQITTNENEETTTKVEDSNKKIEMPLFLFWIKKHCWKWIFDLANAIYSFFYPTKPNIKSNPLPQNKNNSIMGNISKSNNNNIQTVRSIKENIK